ncbi:Uncharacterised protein [Klebsiella pneumoniae]|uniref:DUF1471 domain-containing protein n=1 Tax=Klebsiella pneumoniae TaxID=573 RepID=UPI000E2CFE4C|nr:DUF1471 domain-containing protein [Klebsiella pneumoniae]SYO73597.1 Uncharacterised protein [Klebsiella pneumoniae]
MKALINDVIAVFTRKAHGPVIIKSDLTEEEKAALVPVRTLSVGWVSSVDELEREVAAYLISELEQARFVHARATLFA